MEPHLPLELLGSQAGTNVGRDGIRGKVPGVHSAHTLVPLEGGAPRERAQRPASRSAWTSHENV